MKPLPDQIERVIWIQTSFLGDIIIQTAAMKLLAQQRPRVQQILVTTPTGKAALAGQSFVSSCHVFDKRAKGLAAFRQLKGQLKKEGFLDRKTIVLQPHKSFRSSLLARYLGCYTITYFESALSFLSDYRCSRVAVFHEAHRIGLLLEPLGFSRQDIVASRPYLEPLSSIGSESAVFDWIGEMFGRPIVAVAPGSVWGTKRWPAKKFVELIGKLQKQNSNIAILLLGSSAEQEVCQQIAHEVSCIQGDDAKGLYNAAGQTSLQDLRVIYPQLKLLVTNDSSPVHYASSFNIPAITLFGATVPAMGFGPLSDGSLVAQYDELNCRPCSDHGPQVCPLGHFKCMKNLEVDLVLQKCQLAMA